jgi:hypothetical protein
MAHIHTRIDLKMLRCRTLLVSSVRNGHCLILFALTSLQYLLFQTCTSPQDNVLLPPSTFSSNLEQGKGSKDQGHLHELPITKKSTRATAFIRQAAGGRVYRRLPTTRSSTGGTRTMRLLWSRDLSFCLRMLRNTTKLSAIQRLLWGQDLSPLLFRRTIMSLW